MGLGGCAEHREFAQRLLAILDEAELSALHCAARSIAVDAASSLRSDRHPGIAASNSSATVRSCTAEFCLIRAGRDGSRTIHVPAQRAQPPRDSTAGIVRITNDRARRDRPCTPSRFHKARPRHRPRLFQLQPHRVAVSRHRCRIPRAIRSPLRCGEVSGDRPASARNSSETSADAPPSTVPNEDVHSSR